jgi:hypothetical protein
MYKWYARFLGGQQSIHDDKLSGRPNVTSNHVAVIEELLDNDRRITIREIHERSDCSIGTVHRIIHDELNMRRLCARWIPKMLTDEQKWKGCGVAINFSDAFIGKVNVSCDG